MSAEERRRAFAHRINQLVGDHMRSGYMMSVGQRADLAGRMGSALEDAYQMGTKVAMDYAKEQREQLVVDAINTTNLALEEGIKIGQGEKVAERIEPQE